jgi:hypothetical protein
MKANPLDYFQAETEGQTLEGLSRRLYQTGAVLEAACTRIDEAIKKCPDADNTRDLIKTRAMLEVVANRLNNDQLAILKRTTPKEDGPQPETA